MSKVMQKKFEIWYNAREEVYIIQAPTPEVKATWVNEIRKVLTSQLQACREASQHRTLEHTQSLPLPASSCTSPSRNNIRNVKKMDERKADLTSLEGYVTTVAPKYPEKGKGWAKTSHSLDASEENDGWSSAEEPLNSSDAEEEGGGGGERNEMKLTPGKYTVVSDYEKGVSEEFAVKGGDLVQLIREGEEGLWYVKNLTTGREGWIPANNLLMLIGNSKSAQSLSSSESGTASSTLSTSSSCSDSCNASSTSFSDIKG